MFYQGNFHQTLLGRIIKFSQSYHLLLKAADLCIEAIQATHWSYLVSIAYL